MIVDLTKLIEGRSYTVNYCDHLGGEVIGRKLKFLGFRSSNQPRALDDSKPPYGDERITVLDWEEVDGGRSGPSVRMAVLWRNFHGAEPVSVLPATNGVHR